MQVRESATSLLAVIGNIIGPAKLKPLLEKVRKSSVQNVSDKLDSLSGSVGSLIDISANDIKHAKKEPENKVLALKKKEPESISKKKRTPSAEDFESLDEMFKT